MPMSEVLNTFIIEKNALVREGLKALLKKSDYLPVIALEDIKQLTFSENEDECALIVLGAEELSAEEVVVILEGLKSTCPQARVLVLTSTLSIALVTASFSAGASGFILNDISPDAFLRSLDLVMLGEKVFPTAMAALVSTQENADVSKNQTENSNTKFLSERETEIIMCLEGGEPNKVIARRLGITEATVKVHVKAILRKLRLKNRTQAAMWAVNNGLVPALELSCKPETQL